MERFSDSVAADPGKNGYWAVRRDGGAIIWGGAAQPLNPKSIEDVVFDVQSTARLFFFVI